MERRGDMQSFVVFMNLSHGTFNSREAALGVALGEAVAASDTSPPTTAGTWWACLLLPPLTTTPRLRNMVLLRRNATALLPKLLLALSLVTTGSEKAATGAGVSSPFPAHVPDRRRRAEPRPSLQGAESPPGS